MIFSTAKAQLSSSTALVLALFYASAASAQTADQPPAPPPVVKPTTTTQVPPPASNAESQEDDDNIIVVEGLRASLENALEQKRNSDVIIDGISSDDIGSTPDLNLGEALQRIPGVQIDRSEERRNASVSVRGLQGRFANTSLMGQSIARVNRRNSSGNPFGIFDASIFNGSNIIKSFNAETLAGGLSANIDLRLNSALSRKDGLVLRAELQYEETTKDFNPAYFAGFSKKLSDNFGVYGNVAYSKQSFRRDEISINSYNRFSNARAAQFGVAATASDGTAQHLYYPGEVRIQTRNEAGDRLSASGGIEFKPIDGLSLRVDGIFTRRNLDDARLDVLRLQFTDIGANLLAGDTTGQVSVGTNTDGSFNIINAGTGRFGAQEGNIFIAPVISSNNTPYFADTRVFAGKDQVWAIYPAIEYEGGGWKARIVGTVSKAVGADTEILVGARRPIVANTTSSRVAQNTLTNGVNVAINTGAGNFSDLSLTTNLPTPLFDLNNRTYTTTAARTTATTVDLPGRARNDILVTGTPNSVNRDLYSIAGDFERELGFGPFTALKFGARYDKESGRTFSAENMLAGTNLANLDDDIIRDHLGFSTGGQYFGGQISGLINGPQIFGVNVDRVVSLLQEGGLAPPIASPLLPTNLPTTSTTANPLTPAQIAANIATNAANNTTNIGLIGQSAGAGFVVVNTNGSGNANSSVPIDAVIIPSTGFYALPETIATGNALNRIRQGNFATDRKNFEAYGQLSFNLEDWSASGVPIRGNVGLRYVRASLVGQDTINNPAIPDLPAEGTYSAFLPSANLIWTIDPKLQFRAAYYNTFEAFDVAEFTPAPTYATFTPTNPNATTPQPDDFDVFFSTLDVEPRKSEAFDLLLSWYNRPGGIISVGYFNKSVRVNQSLRLCPEGGSVSAPLFNPATGAIENRNLGPIYINPNNTDECRIDVLGTRIGDFGDPSISISQTLQVATPVTIQGVEAQIQQDLRFLPGFLKNFGVILNASRIWTEKVDGIEFFNVSKYFGNAILYYEDKLLQGRLAYNYAAETNLGDGGSFNGLGRTVAGRGQLDFSGAIKPIKGLEIRAEVFNITNAIRRDFQNFEVANRRASYDGRTYSLGLTYKF
ncbi:MAG: TonB-dependent receptor [Sphingomonadales bacterium]|nr:TonB-dependent receptor [Sphingomonadales bacterium]